MEEKKILDKEFRSKLFKDLISAGFSKEQAQNLLYEKFYETLKDETLEMIQGVFEAVNNNEIPESFDGDKLNGYLTDLRKAKEVLEKDPE